jgi:integrase
MPRTRRGRGEGGVFQRESDGLWRRRLVAYGTSKKEALEKLEEKKGKARAGIVTYADRLTVKEYLERWLRMVKPNVGATTWARYEQHVRLHLAPRFGRVLLTKLTALHVAQLFSDMESAGESAACRKKVGTALRMALKQACLLRLITVNVALNVKLPKVTREEIQPLDPEQMGRFLVASEPDRLHALYVLALDSGMRQGELFGLHWPEIDFGSRSVYVKQSLGEIDGVLTLKEVKTKHARRRIDLSPDTLDVLNAHRQQMLAEGRDVKSGPVFVDTQGGFLRKTNLQRNSFKAILKRGQLPDVRFHDLRHTCATLLLLADENVKVVSERLGHARIQITLDVYSHVLPTMQKRAAEKMSVIFAAARASAAASTSR